MDGVQTFSGALTLANAGNRFNGDGAGLTGLNAGGITRGTLADVRLSANVALRDAAQTFTGTNVFSHASNRFTGAFTGNGGGLTNLNAGSLTGAVPAAALTSVPAARLTGTVADARLSPNVPRLDAAQTFGGPNSFNSDVGLNMKDVLLRGLSDGNHGLGWYGDGKPFAGMMPDGPVLYGWRGGMLGTREGDPRIALAWDAAGNVGVGTASPAARLDVAGVVKATTFLGDGAQLTGLDRTSWSLGGNANVAPGDQFLGTRDNQPLEFRVNNQRALRLEPTGVDDAVNVIGGSGRNSVGAGIRGATIGGGGPASPMQGPNSVSAVFGTIGGGTANSIGQASSMAAIGGGGDNAIQSSAPYSTIPGGVGNVVSNHALAATIGGGVENRVGEDASWPTIGGGNSNYILPDGHFGTIPGGFQNVAGTQAFAAGSRAKAIHTGAFVWADSTDADFASTTANQFRVRALGGMEILGSVRAVDGIRTGAFGTLQSRVQFGTAAVGTGVAGVNTFTIPFSAQFSGPPMVFVVARGNDNSDTFAVSTRAITRDSFRVNVLRLDVPGGWGQNLQLDWYAVE